MINASHMLDTVAVAYVIVSSIAWPLGYALHRLRRWRATQRLQDKDAITITQGVGILTDDRGLPVLLRSRGLNAPQMGATLWIAAHQLAEQTAADVANDLALTGTESDAGRTRVAHGAEGAAVLR